MTAVTDRCQRQINDMKIRLDREIKLRDDIIIKEREVNLKKNRELVEEAMGKCNVVLV